jgi:CRISPR-associated protein Cas1
VSFVYVAEHGAVLRKQGGELAVTKEDETLLQVEMAGLVSVVILSTVQVTTQCLAALLEAGTELAIISSRGRLLGQLTPPLARNQAIRRAQFERETDAAWALEQARAVVIAKLGNQRQVLARFSAEETGSFPTVKEAIARLDDAAGRAGAAPDAASLLGYEGSGAAAYWAAFPTLLKAPGIEFPGRRARPATDPVNAALSFGYVLLTNMMTSLLDAYGLDPFMGFMHTETYGTPALALDLVEPFRAPVVDRMVVRLFNLRMLDPEDFAPEGEEPGLRMSEDAVRLYFREWERQLGRLSVREAIKAQAEGLARALRGDAPVVQPWSWP